MQGKLSEIDIRSILQLIELGQRTGELFVEAYPVAAGIANDLEIPSARSTPQPRRFWFVFFLNGQIIYAADTDTSVSRLADYLRRYNADSQLSQLTVPSIASISAPEYGYLWALLESHALTPAQGRNIIRGMVHETLFDLLSLHQGTFIFELGSPLSPQLVSLEITPLLAKIMQQVQQWKQLHSYIQSPDQCPIVTDAEALQQAVSLKTFATLRHYADGRTSIRSIARHLHRDILTVAKAIYPFVQRGVIQLTYSADEVAGGGRGSGRSPVMRSGLSPRMREFAYWQHPSRSACIVCIDDSAVIRESVHQMLPAQHYQVTGFGNPLEALSQVFQLKPDLILCDIGMPELDGYELCAMLRRSSAFCQTPIIMLTGKDGYIDRVRARMVGATDYLTKPFGESELLMLVEKYIGLGEHLPYSGVVSNFNRLIDDSIVQQYAKPDASSP
jgi:twitching motility two-component system response regulator PilG